MKKIPHLRWWIVAMLFLASVLNYIDRQILSILAPTVQQELKLTDGDYARVVNLFLIAYLLAYLLSGRLVDKVGTRLSLMLFVGWWSLANIATGFSRSLGSLGLFRFLLGLGEAGNWTAAPKAVSEWFPARERGLAIGLYTLGATIGATLAPVLIVGLASFHSWQAAFVVTGLAGLAWLIPWLWLYRRPEEHPRITREELEWIKQPGTSAPAGKGPVPSEEEKEKWHVVLRRREVGLLMVGRLVTDPVWYFYQFWFAKYLYQERGLDQKALTVTWVIFLAADLGAVGGGWFSGRLIKRGIGVARSRLWIMLGCAALLPFSALIPQTGPLALALALGMLITFAHMAWQINVSALVVDVIPQRSLATTFGIVAAGSAAGGIFMNEAVVWAISRFSYQPVFWVMGCLHPMMWLVLWFGGRRAWVKR